jgi:hypothetical protein
MGKRACIHQVLLRQLHHTLRKAVILLVVL